MVARDWLVICAIGLLQCAVGALDLEQFRLTLMPLGAVGVSFVVRAPSDVLDLSPLLYVEFRRLNARGSPQRADVSCTHGYQLSQGYEDGWDGWLCTSRMEFFDNHRTGGSYEYRVVTQGRDKPHGGTEWRTFAAPAGSRVPSSTSCSSFFVVADTGATNWQDIVQEMQKHVPGRLVDEMPLPAHCNGSTALRAVLHVGDFGYAALPGKWDFDLPDYRKDKADSWDRWFKMTEPLAASVPYMVAPGNHETYRFDDRNFVPYEARMLTPGKEQGHPFWYSFASSGVHFVVLSSEHAYHHGSPQHNWLMSEFHSVDRVLTPWLVVCAHRPIYSSARGSGVHRAMQGILEPVFTRYQVDLFFSGHHHAYERTKPQRVDRTRQMSEVPLGGDDQPAHSLARSPPSWNGTVHVLTGTGGFALEKRLTEPAPAWSARRVIARGFTVMDVSYAAQKSLLTVSFLAVDKGQIMDTFTLSRPVEHTEPADGPHSPDHEEL